MLKKALSSTFLLTWLTSYDHSVGITFRGTSIYQVGSQLTRGVRFIVSALPPDSYPEDGRDHHVKLIRELQDAGIRVITPDLCHTRYAIIDQSIVWYGSLNLLSNPKDGDNLMRIENPEIALELLELGCVGKE